MGDPASGVIALSQWISSDGHFGAAKDADAWKRDHVAALENVVQYVNLGKGGRGTASSSSASSPRVNGVNVYSARSDAQAGPSHRRLQDSGEAHTSYGRGIGGTSSRPDRSTGVHCLPDLTRVVRAEHESHCLHKSKSVPF